MFRELFDVNMRKETLWILDVQEEPPLISYTPIMEELQSMCHVA